jgi:hypothetical protein
MPSSKDQALVFALNDSEISFHLSSETAPSQSERTREVQLTGTVVLYINVLLSSTSLSGHETATLKYESTPPFPLIVA